MPEEGQPGRTFAAGQRLIVNSKNSTHEVLVNVHTEVLRNLLGDSRTPATWIEPFELDDSRDQIGAWSVGTRFAAFAG